MDVVQETRVQFQLKRSGNRPLSYLAWLLELPADFLPELVGPYSDIFSASLKRCVELFEQPLFGGPSERLALTTSFQYKELKYHLANENPELASEDIRKIGETFEAFIRHFAQRPLRPTMQTDGPHTCSASLVYSSRWTRPGAGLELEFYMPASMTRQRFTAFRTRALTDTKATREQDGRMVVQCHEPGNATFNGSFSIKGSLLGALEQQEIRTAVSELLQLATDDLAFSEA